MCRSFFTGASPASSLAARDSFGSFDSSVSASSDVSGTPGRVSDRRDFCFFFFLGGATSSATGSATSACAAASVSSADFLRFFFLMGAMTGSAGRAEVDATGSSGSSVNSGRTTVASSFSSAALAFSLRFFDFLGAASSESSGVGRGFDLRFLSDFLDLASWPECRGSTCTMVLGRKCQRECRGPVDIADHFPSGRLEARTTQEHWV
jgi:hypothetical protein